MKRREFAVKSATATTIIIPNTTFDQQSKIIKPDFSNGS